MRFSSQIYVDRAARVHTKKTTVPNWHNTKMKVDKSSLEKGRILIISYYLGMPCQLAEPNLGTFSASSHLWDAVRWKQRDQTRFQIHSNEQFKFSIPRPAVGPLRFTDPGLVPANVKGSCAKVRYWHTARDKIFKIRAEMSEDLMYKKILHIWKILYKRDLLEH